MTEYKLRGFLGNTLGGEDSLRVKRPLLSYRGGYYLPNREDWSASDLKKVDDSDLDHFTFFSESFHLTVREADLVWLMGGDLLRATRASALTAVWHRFASWPVWGPVRYRLGSLEDFQRLNIEIFNLAKPALHAALFDRFECSHGDARKIFHVLDAMTGISPDQIEVERALFYLEMRDMDSYEYVRASAVIDEYFQSEQEFDREVRRKRDWLKEPRMRESGWTAHATLHDRLVWTPEAVKVSLTKSDEWRSMVENLLRGEQHIERMG